jgi:hypothetical protein
MARVRIWEKHRVACGFSWLLRVIDHEAALMDPKLFSSWVRRSVVLLKRGFGRQTNSRWRFSQKNDWVVQVTPQQWGEGPQPSPPSREGTTPLALIPNPTPKGSTTYNMASRGQRRQTRQLQHHQHRLKPRDYLECGLKPQRPESGRWNPVRYCVGVVRGPWPLARSVLHPPYFFKRLPNK